MSGPLYLGRRHLDGLGLEPGRVVDLLEEVFRLRARGETEMPPKLFFQLEGDRFYSAMASACPALGFAGAKWQSGDPANPGRGLPYVQGLYVLNEHRTGRMVAVIDAEWLTGIRTAAASALVARHLSRRGCRELALLGCGVQGRAHLEALAAELPGLERCRAFDVVAERQAGFVADLDRRHGGVRVRGAGDAESAVRGADLVVTGGPITIERRATVLPEWIAPGALVVAIDYDSYVTDGCIAAMDLVLTDDRAQLEHERHTSGKFAGVGRIDADLAELVARGRGRRRDDRQRVLAFNLGIALEDLATAAEVYRRALAAGAGTRLDG